VLKTSGVQKWRLKWIVTADSSLPRTTRFLAFGQAAKGATHRHMMAAADSGKLAPLRMCGWLRNFLTF
jgi:hypothetical protein